MISQYQCGFGKGSTMDALIQFSNDIEKAFS